MLDNQRIAILGTGKIGVAIGRGLIRTGAITPDRLRGTVAHEENASRVGAELGIIVDTDSAGAAAAADVVVLAVKPQAMDRLLGSIRESVAPHQLVISVAASVPTAFVEERLSPGVPVVRAMPNTPCLLGDGMTVLCAGTHAVEEHLKKARSIFDAVGKTAVLDERLMDGVTGLSGSGPAYIYLVIESLAEAGVKVGIPRDVSTLLSAQTMLGAARMVLELREHPALLKDMVTTPAGCTIDGLLELEEGGVRVSLIKAVVKATARAKELIEAGQ
jgi:pyrroline-5-carboxylate reductase